MHPYIAQNLYSVRARELQASAAAYRRARLVRLVRRTGRDRSPASPLAGVPAPRTGQPVDCAASVPGSREHAGYRAV
jgi:hypothetical protein